MLLLLFQLGDEPESVDSVSLLYVKSCSSLNSVYINPFLGRCVCAFYALGLNLKLFGLLYGIVSGIVASTVGRLYQVLSCNKVIGRSYQNISTPGPARVDFPKIRVCSLQRLILHPMVRFSIEHYSTFHVFVCLSRYVVANFKYFSFRILADMIFQIFL